MRKISHGDISETRDRLMRDRVGLTSISQDLKIKHRTGINFFRKLTRRTKKEIKKFNKIFLKLSKFFLQKLRFPKCQ